MELTEKQKAAQKQIKSIIFKCWEDENFKQELMSNPVQTIEKIKGSPLNIPEGTKLIVNDQSNTSEFHFNIPSKPNFDNVELTDKQLELVAGGNIIDDAKEAVAGAVVSVVLHFWNPFD